jgi:hypothetical protein
MIPTNRGLTLRVDLPSETMLLASGLPSEKAVISPPIFASWPRSTPPRSSAGRRLCSERRSRARDGLPAALRARRARSPPRNAARSHELRGTWAPGSSPRVRSLILPQIGSSLAPRALEPIQHSDPSESPPVIPASFAVSGAIDQNAGKRQFGAGK